MNISRREFKIIVFSIAGAVLTLGLVGIFAAGLFIYSGRYDISAGRPHWALTQMILTQLKRRSVAHYADSQNVPDLNDPVLIRSGFRLYREQCVTCHGAPGVPRERIGLGLNPNPPPLLQAAENWKPHEIAWIIENGLKMAGMPAFGFGQPKKNIWALTAFVQRMQTLTPAGYLAMVSGEPSADLTAFLVPKVGWQELSRRGNVEAGKELVQKYSCHKCHEIEGLSHPRGTSSSSMRKFRKRHYISGQFLNEPYNLVNWIKDPVSMDPHTAMPVLGVTTPEAWAIASYLYQLDE